MTLPKDPLKEAAAYIATLQDAPEPTRPICVVQVEDAGYCLALDFAPLDGRIHGFAYAHLLTYLWEKNPDATLHPHAPPDRFTLCFSTHDVVLLGVRLSALAPLLQRGKIASLRAVEDRYAGLEDSAPVITQIEIKAASKD